MVRVGAGGIKFNTMVPLTKLGDNPADVIYRICHEYRMHNCEVVFREDARSAQAARPPAGLQPRPGGRPWALMGVC